MRKQCFPPDSVNVMNKGMYAIYFTVPRIASDHNWWYVYIALGSRVVHLRPDPHGTMRAVFTCMPREGAHRRVWEQASRSNRKTQQELVRLEFADAGWQVQRLREAMDDAADFYTHPMQLIKMSNWSNGRIVCVGDAAYAPTAITRMGTTLAITGAYILALELSKLDHVEHMSTALEAYEATFCPFVEEVQRLPWCVPSMGNQRNAWQRSLLQLSLSVLLKLLSTRWVADQLAREHDQV